MTTPITDAPGAMLTTSPTISPTISATISPTISPTPMTPFQALRAELDVGAAIDARRALAKTAAAGPGARGLFIDGGSNLGYSRSAGYAEVVLKLDIEGGEYAVLPDLINPQMRRVLDTTHIEFHSQYMAEPQATAYRALEVPVRQTLTQDRVPHRIWI